MHCIVTAGGLTQEPGGSPAWIDARQRFLFPVRVLGALFRGKLLAMVREAWRAGTLPDPHGRGVAVLLSLEAYEELEAAARSTRLQAAVDEARAQYEAGEWVEGAEVGAMLECWQHGG